MKKTPIINFDHCSIGSHGNMLLRDFSWQVNTGETWIITGLNGSGKSALIAALCGQLEVFLPNGTICDSFNQYHGKTGVLSFDRQMTMVFDEWRNDDSDFVEGGVDAGTTVRRFILRQTIDQNIIANFHLLSEELEIRHLLERGIKYLSTGEIRKILLCRELISNPDLLVLDEFMEGLDTATRQVLNNQITAMIDRGSPQLILVSDRYAGFPEKADHVLCLEDCRLSFAGTRNEFEVSDSFRRLYTLRAPAIPLPTLEMTLTASSTFSTELLLDMKQVNVSWDGRMILENFNWQLPAGKHTLIRGPNGCGKTTLLKLITGDNPQVFANDITVLGLKRGNGESIWDIKAGIGYVSYQLHLDYLYHGHASLEETLLSGFHDSIGLYTQTGSSEIGPMNHWLSIMGLSEKRKVNFASLSWGEQRAALIARAAIKNPPILILDEPCHGLDSIHRHRVLEVAEHIGRIGTSTLIHVTHDPTEVLSCTQQTLDFIPVLTTQSPENQPHYRCAWS